MANFMHLKAGDKVTRMFGGGIKMPMLVVDVKENTLICEGGWEFDRETGVEEDELFGWGRKFGKTGSCLVEGD